MCRPSRPARRSSAGSPNEPGFGDNCAPMSGSWPYLTAAIPPVSAEIKTRVEDFVVEELPLYDASGEGDHVYLELEKRGLTTLETVRLVAKRLGVAPRD